MTWFYQNNALEIEAANDGSSVYNQSWTATPEMFLTSILDERGFVYDKTTKKVLPKGTIIQMEGDNAELGGTDTPPDSVLTSFRTLLASYRRSFKYLMVLMKALLKGGGLPKIINATTPGVLNPVQRMFIYVNIIDPIDLNDQFVRLLKLVNTRGESFKTTQEDILHPMYHPVQKGKISMIEVLIADENGDPVSFQIGTVVLTLHFRKVIKSRL